MIVNTCSYTKQAGNEEIMFGHLPKGALEAEFPPKNYLVVRKTIAKMGFPSDD